ncbi:MAG TPA: glycosyltransferase family 39 protein [Burkholderiales bacterium]|nr:glycosyltransferase family 39 protein [Burkholderiales bacterium]
MTVRGERGGRLLFAAAVLSSLAALPLYFVGEEAILANSAMEMAYRGDWLRHWLYGLDGQHSTGALWLIIPLSGLAGWDHVLAVSRSVMIAATAGTGAMLWLLTRRLYRNAALAAFAAAAYVTLGDTLFLRGWLTYRDPLFACFVFASIATLWIAAREGRLGWLAASHVFLALGFLTKGLTAYVFWGSAAFVLLFSPRERAFLLRPASWVLGFAGLAVPALWFTVVLGGGGQGTRMAAEIVSKLAAEGLAAWGLKLLAYPADVLARMLPLSLLAAWYLRRSPEARRELAADPVLRTALAILLLAFLPYWLAPQSHVRYLAPILPLAALGAAVAIFRCGEPAVAVTVKWLWAAVVLKLLLLAVALPWYQEHYRGRNYAEAAQAIFARTRGQPLYVTDVSASGLSVTAHLNLLRLPQPPLLWPPRDWGEGFIIARTDDPALGRVAERYRLGGDNLYLLCRGSACAQQ